MSNLKSADCNAVDQGYDTARNKPSTAIRSASHLPDLPIDFRVMSSIRCDANLQGLRINSELGPDPEQACMFYMLRYHRDRMFAAASEFGWSQACHALYGEKGVLFLEQTLNEHVNSQCSNNPPPAPMQARIFRCETF